MGKYIKNFWYISEKKRKRLKLVNLPNYINSNVIGAGTRFFDNEKLFNLQKYPIDLCKCYIDGWFQFSERIYFHYVKPPYYFM